MKGLHDGKGQKFVSDLSENKHDLAGRALDGDQGIILGCATDMLYDLRLVKSPFWP